MQILLAKNIAVAQGQVEKNVQEYNLIRRVNFLNETEKVKR
jgi:hypothetical protein